jgi:hypothetical protein
MTGRIDRLRQASPLSLAALVAASLALFVALGGTSYAAGLLIGTKQIKPNAVTSGKIKNNRVSSADLKDNGVQSADLANGGIQMTDLSDPLQAKVNDVGGGGLIDTGQLANGAVTNPKLGTNSVSSSKVAANSLSSGDLGASSVGGSEIAANGVGASEIATGAVAGAEVAGNAVQGDEIENGSLSAADVGQHSGSAGRNFGAIPAGTCGFVFIDPAPGPGSIDDRVAVVTPGAGFTGNVSFHAEAEGSQLRLKACNPSGAAVDPDGAGTNYNYIVFG